MIQVLDVYNNYCFRQIFSSTESLEANMRLFPPLIQIDENEGFTATKDIFGRKRIADELTHLVSIVEDPLVLAVDGQLGSGKTIFLKMWRGELQKLGYHVVYFDAYANDYFEDAFIPLAAEIVELAHSKLNENKSKYDEFKSKTITATKVLLRSGLKIGLKAATLGVLDAGEIEGTIAEEIENTFDEHIGALITKKDAAKSNMESFKEALESLPKLFSESNSNSNPAKPIIIIIDELDRCKPSYALQVLERMKHCFSVSKVHFVLGVNLAQLSNSVVATYGAGVDGQLYLQKFIQLSLQLQDRFEHDRITTTSKFLLYLSNQSELVGKNLEFIQQCNTELERIAEQKNFSLRTLEQIYGHVIRVVAVTPTGHFIDSAIVVGLAVLKVTESHLFSKAKRGLLEYSQVSLAFGLLDRNDPNINSANNEFEERLRQQEWFDDLWRYLSDKNCPEQTIERVSRFLLNWSFSRRNRLTHLQWYVNERFDRFVPVGL
jgi:hypothetical protein